MIEATHTAFVVAARDAALATRFTPARAGGHAVRQLVRQAMVFRVRE